MKIHRKDFRGNWVILTKLHRPVCIFDRHTPEWTGNRRENCIFAVTNFRIAEKEKRNNHQPVKDDEIQQEDYTLYDYTLIGQLIYITWRRFIVSSIVHLHKNKLNFAARP